MLRESLCYTCCTDTMWRLFGPSTPKLIDTRPYMDIYQEELDEGKSKAFQCSMCGREVSYVKNKNGVWEEVEEK